MPSRQMGESCQQQAEGCQDVASYPFSDVYQACGLCLTSWTWSSNTLVAWCQEPTHWKRPWCWERQKTGGEGDDRGWDGWMASLTLWTWVWVNLRRRWTTEEPGVLQSTGSERVRHDPAIEQQQSQRLELGTAGWRKVAALVPWSWKSSTVLFSVAYTQWQRSPLISVFLSECQLLKLSRKIVRGIITGQPWIFILWTDFKMYAGYSLFSFFFFLTALFCLSNSHRFIMSLLEDTHRWSVLFTLTF